MSRSQLNYKTQKKEDASVVAEILQTKEKHPYYGVPKITAVLRRSGKPVNAKRVYRIMKTLNLLAKRKPRRRKVLFPKTKYNVSATRPDQVWAMDFVMDHLENGTKFRCFTVIDTYTRVTPLIEVSFSMSEFLPVKFLTKLQKE
ncbi:MAG: hypothetical protein EOP06_09615, partial [Proteobacteria bacterium]